MNAVIDTAKPSASASLRGAFEKPQRCRPWRNSSSFSKGYLVSPAKRSSRSYTTPRLLEAYPAEHSSDETIALSHCLVCLERFPVDTTKISDIGGNVDISKFPQ